jgi:ferredoxin-like protein FixX
MGLDTYLHKEWKVYVVKEYCLTCGAAKLLSESIVPKWCTN